jgi:hypothetical protein
MDEEHRTSGDVAEMSKVRKNITVSEDLFDAFMSLKRDGETQGGLMRRVIDSMHSRAALVKDLEDLEDALDTLCSTSCLLRISRRKRSISGFQE